MNNNNRNITDKSQYRDLVKLPKLSRSDRNNRRLRGVHALESVTASHRPKEIETA